MTSVLITGGTGSFGRAFARYQLDNGAERVVIYSRDEWKQHEMRRDFDSDPRLRFFIGDVRDGDRLRRACEGVDVVAHAAALKQVPACEYNPREAVRTNVLGAMNVIDAAMDTGVGRVVALSTDKAAAPVNLYGATKLCSDKLFLAANEMVGGRDLRFNVVRYGNVWGSRGSVVPLWTKLARGGHPINVTDPEMTRFSITMGQAIGLVVQALDGPGCMFVPKAPSYRLEDLAVAVCLSYGVGHVSIGMRPGEKMHEMLITTDDMGVVEYAGHYTIGAPPSWLTMCVHVGADGEAQPVYRPDARLVDDAWSYRSDTNPHRLTVEELRGML